MSKECSKVDDVGGGGGGGPSSEEGSRRRAPKAKRATTKLESRDWVLLLLLLQCRYSTNWPKSLKYPTRRSKSEDDARGKDEGVPTTRRTKVDPNCCSSTRRTRRRRVRSTEVDESSAKGSTCTEEPGSLPNSAFAVVEEGGVEAVRRREIERASGQRRTRSSLVRGDSWTSASSWLGCSR